MTGSTEQGTGRWIKNAFPIGQALDATLQGGEEYGYVQ